MRDRSNRVLIWSCVGVMALGATTLADAQRLTATLIAGGFDEPLDVVAPPGDVERLFVVERRSGLIRIIRDGIVLPEPFLDLSRLMIPPSDLRGLVFHPDYDDNGHFYIFMTDGPALEAVVRRYTVSADPDRADPQSGFDILRGPTPNAQHVGGPMAFGPHDGYLYIARGDGGVDPHLTDHPSQDGSTFVGKLLRLDVDGGSPYAIPPDNPFVNDPNVLDEIYALGLRNVWRFSFDEATGHMVLADVGEDRWESVNVIEAGSGGGQNFGWNIIEGSHCHHPPINCDRTGLTLPIFEYPHRAQPQRCAIIGGPVSRGEALPLHSGMYFFADYCSGEVASLRFDGRRVTGPRDWSDQISIPGQAYSWGVDGRGEMLLADGITGEIYRIEAAMRLEATALVGGRPATLSVEGATPEARVHFVYSTVGTGRTRVAGLGVDLALDSPQLAASTPADGAGQAEVTGRIPPRASGQRVWLQAAELGNASNVVRRRVR